MSVEDYKDYTDLSVTPDSQFTEDLGQHPSVTAFPDALIGACQQLKEIGSIVEKIAATKTTVLIQGESGTGKELVARALHASSGVKGKFVAVNCGAIPAQLLETMLFGHIQGAFTGATKTHSGCFQEAHQGTLFLDEIGELNQALQVKLLRALQEHTIQPVGSSEEIPVNIRVIAATNSNLQEEVTAGRFREDLYFRLQVVPVDLPPLRERENDIEILTNYFLQQACSQANRQPMVLSSEARELIFNYDWPGNVRELKNLCERLALLVKGKVITIDDLPRHMREFLDNGTHTFREQTIPANGLDLKKVVSDFEVGLIRAALERTNGNKQAAAKLLKIKRTTLIEKLKKYSLSKKIEFLSK